MTQLIINVEKKSMVSVLKKLLKELNGVSIQETYEKDKSGIEMAFEDIDNGNISGPFNTVEEVIAHLDQ